MKKILNHLFEHRSFSRKEAHEILTNIATGKYNLSQIAAFMTAYSMRSIREEELAGFRDSMYNLSLKRDYNGYKLIDLCGTGGDGKNTFNISTLASFIVAGVGHKVAKHGNYGVSSGCGSSNVMEYLGYQFSNEQDEISRSLGEANICFLHAPLFHPAMKNVAPIRKELGVKTFFNMLGPMINPANPIYQSVGVFSLELARLYGYIYQKTNKQFSVIHALDGYDEVSLTGNYKIITNRAEQIVDIKELGFEAIDPNEIRGGETVEEAAKVFKRILSGEGTDTQNKVVLVNAAIAINTIDQDVAFSECYAKAEESLLGGHAFDKFKALLKQ